MAANAPGHENQGGGLFNIFRRRNPMPRKSAPSTAPIVSPSLIENSDDDSAEESEVDLPESGDSNGNEDPPSRQLRRESRMSVRLSKGDVAETVADSTRSLLPSSPSKSVHFSDIVEDEQESVDQSARETVYLLRHSKSRRQPASQSSAMKSVTGKLKRPAVQTSSPRNGKIDDPTRPSSLQSRSSDGRRDTYDVEESPMRTRKETKKLEVNAAQQQSSSSVARSTSPGSEKSSPNISQSASLGHGQPWSDEDEYTLKVLRDAGMPWPTLEEVFPHRTHIAIYKRYQKIRKGLEVPADAWRTIRERYAQLLQSVDDGKGQQRSPQTSEQTQKRSREQEYTNETSDGRSAKRTKHEVAASLRSQRPVRKRRMVQRSAAADGGEDMNGEIIVAEDQQMDDDELFVPVNSTNRQSPMVLVPERITRNVARRSRQATGDNIEKPDVKPLEEDEPEESQHDGSELDVEEQVATTVDRVYGQQPLLNQIFSAVEKFREEKKGKYGAQYHRTDEIRSIGNVLKICVQTASAYADLQDIVQDDKPFAAEEQKLERTLASLLKIVSRLNPDQDEYEEVYATQVYLYVFPELIDLLRQAITFYATVASLEDSQPRDIALTDLESLVMIGNVIQTLDSHSRKWKTKPNRDNSVVRPIRYQVLAPLRKVLEDWQWHVKKLRERQKEAEVARQYAEEQRRQRDQEERQMRGRAARQEKTGRLARLCIARMAAEPDRYRRFRYFRMPKLRSRRPEVDANGEEFERLPIFKSRRALSHLPHPWEDGEEEWQKDERAALIKALQRFQGSQLWSEDTFLVLCGPYGRLRDRTVVEILKQAKYMQEAWIQWDQEHGEKTEDWIVNIPDLDLLELL